MARSANVALYVSPIRLGALKPATGAPATSREDRAVAAFAIADRWSRRLPDPVTAFAWVDAGGARAPARHELPLVISDHADWRELVATIAETARRVWVTHGREDALLHHIETSGLKGRALASDRPRGRGPVKALPHSTGLISPSKRQAQAACRLFRERARSRSRLCAGGADGRSLPASAAAHIDRSHRIARRSRPVRSLARLCRGHGRDHRPDLAGGRRFGRAGVRRRRRKSCHLAGWLDQLDATGRWALLKLMTGACGRRLGAARQDGACGMVRRAARRYRGGLARASPALWRACSTGLRARRPA